MQSCAQDSSESDIDEEGKPEDIEADVPQNLAGKLFKPKRTLSISKYAKENNQNLQNTDDSPTRKSILKSFEVCM